MTAPEGREDEWDNLKLILSKLAQYRDETLQKPDYIDVQEAETAISVWLAAHDQALIQRVRDKLHPININQRLNMYKLMDTKGDNEGLKQEWYDRGQNDTVELITVILDELEINRHP